MASHRDGSATDALKRELFNHWILTWHLALCWPPIRPGRRSTSQPRIIWYEMELSESDKYCLWQEFQPCQTNLSRASVELCTRWSSELKLLGKLSKKTVVSPFVSFHALCRRCFTWLAAFLAIEERTSVKRHQVAVCLPFRTLHKLGLPSGWCGQLLAVQRLSSLAWLLL